MIVVYMSGSNQEKLENFKSEQEKPKIIHNC